MVASQFPIINNVYLFSLPAIRFGTRVMKPPTRVTSQLLARVPSARRAEETEVNTGYYNSNLNYT